MRTRALLAIGAVALFTACSSHVAARHTAAAATRSISGELVLPTSLQMSPSWHRLMCVTYGSRAAQLGQAPTHGGQSAPSGPEYASPAPDGTWWFLDVEKHRLAHYDRNGGYIGAVSIPGRYVGLQFLHVFANGEMFAPHGVLAANSFVSDGHTAHRVNLPAVADQLSWQYDDGERAYGIGSARAPSQTIHVDNQRPAVTATTTYRTPTGTRFSVYLEDPDTGPLVVSLPDAQPPTRLSLRYHSATHATARPILVFEVASGSDGAIRLFLYGSTDEPQPVTFSGYLRISPAGAISPIEPVANPFSRTDPGSPAHLHVQPGTSSASLVLEGDHCASVYLHRDEVPD